MFNKGKPYVPPPTRSMGTASGYDDLHELDDAELELETEVEPTQVQTPAMTAYSHAAEERGRVADDTPVHASTNPPSETALQPTAPLSTEERSPAGPGGGGGGGSGYGGGGGGHNPSRPSRDAASILGNGMTFEGDISGVGQLVIEGTVKGDVRVSQVLINEKGAVEGTVHADVLDVRGRISGAIIAKQAHLHASARVEGDVTQEQITIERGAWFSGRSTQAKRGEDITAE